MTLAIHTNVCFYEWWSALVVVRCAIQWVFICSKCNLAKRTRSLQLQSTKCFETTTLMYVVFMKKKTIFVTFLHVHLIVARKCLVKVSLLACLPHTRLVAPQQEQSQTLRIIPWLEAKPLSSVIYKNRIVIENCFESEHVKAESSLSRFDSRSSPEHPKVFG